MCPYFGTLWPAGRILAETLATLGEAELRGMGARWLELGCGLALPSLVLAKRGVAAEAADVHPDVATFLATNRQRNGLQVPTFRALDWRSAERSPQIWDVVIASDILYDKTQPATVVQFLSESLPIGGRAMVADPGRTYLDDFMRRSEQAGFSIKRSGSFGVTLLEMRRKL